MPAWHAAVHAITAAVGQEAAGRTGSEPPAESSCRQPCSQTCMGGACDVIVLLMIVHAILLLLWDGRMLISVRNVFAKC